MKFEAAKKRGLALVTSIDEAELAVRLIEAVNGVKRPPGKSARAALDDMGADDRAGWRAGARAAMEYWRECIEAAQRPS